jgi:hypothetical protein
LWPSLAARDPTYGARMQVEVARDGRDGMMSISIRRSDCGVATRVLAGDLLQ